MRIRPYIEGKDYGYLEQWVGDERIHALWCANLMSYPVTREKLHDFLEKSAMEWTDSAYVATEDNGKPFGFFCYSVNSADGSGFLKLVIVDSSKRGRGIGKEMLGLALEYAFCITGVELVRLNVFRENLPARRCYEKLGFVEESAEKGGFPYKDELWGRSHMTITEQDWRKFFH